jgi:hypothetical protein
MKWLLQIVCGADGNPSTMRIAVLLIIGAILANWTYLTIHTGAAQSLDWQQVGLALGALTAKAAQSQIENGAPQRPPLTPPP